MAEEPREKRDGRCAGAASGASVQPCLRVSIFAAGCNVVVGMGVESRAPTGVCLPLLSAARKPLMPLVRVRLPAAGRAFFGGDCLGGMAVDGFGARVRCWVWVQWQTVQLRGRL